MDIGRVAVAPTASKLTPQEREDQRLMETCKEFEAIMLQQMMRSMRATVPKSETSQSFGQEIMQEMYDEKLADEMAKSGGIGLAQVLFRQLNKR